MGALIEPLPCRFDCDYKHEYDTAVSSGTQGGESIVVQVDGNMFTLDDHPLDETVTVEQDQEIPQKARETLCSTPLTKAPKTSENQSANLMLLLKQQKHLQKQPMPEKLQWKGMMNRLHNLGKKSVELP
ncbi:hypothetical protein TNCV_3405101 [Trichonephila clavipes]|nr:hypothetical protein TNCV_3405101 [Trichonephila clavipes]